MESDFDNLIGRAKKDCAVSLERLLLASYSRLLRYVQPRVPSVLKGVVGPDDIVQQTFTQVFLKIATFEGSTEVSFMKWLKVIADNQIQDRVKARLRQKRGGGAKQIVASQNDSVLQLLDIIESDQSTASHKLSRKESMQALHVCIAELPEDYREILHLRYFEGKSVSEVAVAVERSEGAVRGILDRARAKLRDGMGRASQWLSTS